MAMATTQLVRAIRYRNILTWQQQGKTKHSPLRMSWVVVTDQRGNRQLRMQWASEEDF
jgi:hypothetical protein